VCWVVRLFGTIHVYENLLPFLLCNPLTSATKDAPKRKLQDSTLMMYVVGLE
jgi:hypothetical protein